jgi:transposase
VILPAYSPELNPVELAINKAKNHLRNVPFTHHYAIEVANAFATVSQQDMVNMYRHCIEHRGRSPHRRY